MFVTVGEYLQARSFLRRTRDRGFSLGVESLLMTGRRQGDRCIPASPKQLERSIDFTDVNEAAHAQLEPPEAFAVRSQGDIAFGSSCQVAVVRGRQFLARHSLEIEHVDGFVGRRDHFIRLWY